VTPSQIAAVSGHSINEAMKILDTYIPRRGDVAAGAINAWETTNPTGEVFAPVLGLPGNQRRMRLISG